MTKDLVQTYWQPSQPGSLGGVTRFAKAQRRPVQRVRQALERDVAYTLHKPVRRTFPTPPSSSWEGIINGWPIW